jgi:colanic acid/amylovoran biosynthesis glycosyltransferase
MKIAFFIGEFPSLSETFILNQITGLIDLGCNVSIFAVKPSSLAEIHKGVHTYNLLSKTFYSPTIPKNYLVRFLKFLFLFFRYLSVAPLSLLKTLNFFEYGNLSISLRLFYASISFIKINDRNFDIINCHFGHLGSLAACLKEVGIVGGKLCTTFHAWDVTVYLKQSKANPYSKLFTSGDLFLPISERWRALLVEMGCPLEKTIVHHMGVNCEENKYFQRSIGDDGLVNLLSVCRLVEKKGISFAVHAVSKLVEVYPNLKYRIVGDGELRDQLENLAHDLHITQYVSFMGWQTQQDVLKLLQESHIFIAPSVTTFNGDQEGIPIALMEAMSMGLPVISTVHSAIPELIDDRVNGFLVPERDVDALAVAICGLISKSISWSDITWNAREKIEREYCLPKQNEVLYELFRELCPT